MTVPPFPPSAGGSVFGHASHTQPGRKIQHQDSPRLTKKEEGDSNQKPEKEEEMRREWRQKECCHRSPSVSWTRSNNVGLECALGVHR